MFADSGPELVPIGDGEYFSFLHVEFYLISLRLIPNIFGITDTVLLSFKNYLPTIDY